MPRCEPEPCYRRDPKPSSTRLYIQASKAEGSVSPVPAHTTRDVLQCSRRSLWSSRSPPPASNRVLYVAQLQRYVPPCGAVLDEPRMYVRTSHFFLWSPPRAAPALMPALGRCILGRSRAPSFYVRSAPSGARDRLPLKPSRSLASAPFLPWSVSSRFASCCCLVLPHSFRVREAAKDTLEAVFAENPPPGSIAAPTR